MQQAAVPQGWHVASWGTWGWIETGLKRVAIGAGLLAFLTSNAANPLVVGGNPELGAVILMGLMVLFTIVPLVLRFRQQEVISMIYAILNFLGHVGLFVALLRVIDSPVLPLVFAGLMVLGELAKQRFLAISGYTENGQTPAQMLMLSRGVMGIYLLLAIFIPTVFSVRGMPQTQTHIIDSLALKKFQRINDVSCFVVEKAACGVNLLQR